MLNGKSILSIAIHLEHLGTTETFNGSDSIRQEPPQTPDLHAFIRLPKELKEALKARKHPESVRRSTVVHHSPPSSSGIFNDL